MSDENQLSPVWLQMQGHEAAHLKATLERSRDPIILGIHAKLTLLTADRARPRPG